MKTMLLLSLSLSLLSAATSPAQQQPAVAAPAAPLPRIQRNAATGDLTMQIRGFDHAGRTPEMLYLRSLPQGDPATDSSLGLRIPSKQTIVYFEHTGKSVLLISSAEKAKVILWRFDAKTTAPAASAITVEATQFFLRDAQGIATQLSSSSGGAQQYTYDGTRSLTTANAVSRFPGSTSVTAELTFAAQTPAASLAEVPQTLTLAAEQAFLALPPEENNFPPRVFDPRSGFRFLTTPLEPSLPGAPATRNVILRQRLQKQFAACFSACQAEKPIVFWLDSSVPAPLRAAILEGVSWWDAAFVQAGWAQGTLRAQTLPADAVEGDPRYANRIFWSQDTTQPGSVDLVVDPRTGAVLRSTIVLSRAGAEENYHLAEALLLPYDNNRVLAENNPMQAFALAWIRHDTAHQIGKALGLENNPAASSIAWDESVMDEAFPFLALNAEGSVDLSHAYPQSIGPWDKLAISYGYRSFRSKNEEAAALQALLADADRSGQFYIEDKDATGNGSAHPFAHARDNGHDAAGALTHILQVRAAALARLNQQAIPYGAPLSRLQEAVTTLYLLHRDQTLATAKQVGSLNYRYAVRGATETVPEIYDADEQVRALHAVLSALSPATLTLPESALRLLAPEAPGSPRDSVQMISHTGETFDPIGAAETAAEVPLAVLLDPERASRMIEYHMRSPKSPSFRAVLEGISHTTAERPEGGHSMSSEVERAVETLALQRMMSLAVDPKASSQARAITCSHLQDVLDQLTRDPMPDDTAEAIHRRALLDMLHRFEHDPAAFLPKNRSEHAAF
ncbi:MAG: zinc-dependent metalloprotease [Acidobacteriaceae bacterium]|nr:zinc-dependent metalloprotease [Acidobacteriaceae bacterium]